MNKKKILVIGGSSGISEEIVNKLKDTAELYLGSRSITDKSEASSHISFDFDVQKKTALPDNLPESLDGLVYSPGTIRLRPFAQLKDEDYMEDYHINFLGAVRVIREALPRLKKAEGGSSIVLFSTVAVQTGMGYHASIASAKGAIEGLTRSLAAELAPKIRVNAIAPSLTDTPLASQLLTNDQRRQASADRHPLKRIGEADDIANMAVFLLKDASSWMTGQILAVDGGMSSVRMI